MKLSCKIAVVAIALSTAASAFAYTNTTSMSVSATVAATCTVTANPLAFGTYNDATGNNASAAISVTCTSGATVPSSAQLGAGTSFSMTGSTYSGNTLAYSLTTGVGGTGTPVGGASNLLPLAVTNKTSSSSGTVYGSIAAALIAPVDTYADAVVVSVSY